MAEDLSRLNAEVSRLDSNEQREEAVIDALKSKQADLQAQLDAANAGGNQAEIDAAAAHLEAVNARIEALVGVASGTATTTTSTAPSVSDTITPTTDGSNS